MTTDCTLNMDCRSLPLGADLIHSDLRPFLLPPQYESFLMLNLVPGPRIGSILSVASVFILVALLYPTAPETLTRSDRAGEAERTSAGGLSL